MSSGFPTRSGINQAVQPQGTESIHTQVNSYPNHLYYFGQFAQVFSSILSSILSSIRNHFVKFSQFVFIWSIRTQLGQFVVISK